MLTDTQVNAINATNASIVEAAINVVLVCVFGYAFGACFGLEMVGLASASAVMVALRVLRD